MLPYLDQAPLYSKVQWGEPLTQPDNDAVAKTVVAVFLCPSDVHGNGVMPNRRNTSEPRAVTNFNDWISSKQLGNVETLTWKNEGFDEGYQSVPVNWGIGSERKRGFFKLLQEITGATK